MTTLSEDNSCLSERTADMERTGLSGDGERLTEEHVDGEIHDETGMSDNGFPLVCAISIPNVTESNIKEPAKCVAPSHHNP